LAGEGFKAKKGRKEGFVFGSKKGTNGRALPPKERKGGKRFERRLADLALLRRDNCAPLRVRGGKEILRILFAATTWGAFYVIHSSSQKKRGCTKSRAHGEKG